MSLCPNSVVVISERKDARRKSVIEEAIQAAGVLDQDVILVLGEPDPDLPPIDLIVTKDDTVDEVLKRLYEHGGK